MGASATAVIALLLAQVEASVRVNYDSTNATCPDSASERRFRSEPTDQCVGFHLYSTLRDEPKRRVDIFSCRPDGVLTVQLTDDATPSLESFTSGEVEFFLKLADAIEADTETVILENVGTNAAQSVRALRLLARWPPNVALSYEYDAEAESERQRRDYSVLNPEAAPGSPPHIGRRRRLDPGDVAAYTTLCGEVESWLVSAGVDGMAARLATDAPCLSTDNGMYMYNSAVVDEWQCIDPGPPHNEAEWAYGNCFGMCGTGCEGISAVSGRGQFTVDCADYHFCIRFGIGSDGTASTDGCSNEFIGSVDDAMWSGHCDKETGEEVVPDEGNCAPEPSVPPKLIPIDSGITHPPTLMPSERPSSAPSERPSTEPSEMPSFLSDAAGSGNAFHTLPPELTVRGIIALQGVFPSRNRRGLEALKEANSTFDAANQRRRSLGGEDPFIGEIAWFAGNFNPRGWADCNGQLISIAQNQALFSILGTTYGGDGRTNFGLPDIRGRVLHHEGNGPGLKGRSLGEKGGLEEQTLSVFQLATHSHPDKNGYTSEAGQGQPFSVLPPYQAATCIISTEGVFPSRTRREMNEDGDARSDHHHAGSNSHRSLSGSDPFLGEVSWFGGNFAPRGWATCDGQLLTIAQNSALFSLLGTIYGGDGRTTFALPDSRGRMVVHRGQGQGLTNRNIGQRNGVESQSLTMSSLPIHGHSSKLGPVGGGQSFSLMPPFLTLNAVIALVGIFPPRNRRAAVGDVKEGEEEMEWNRRSLGGSNAYLGDIMWVAFNFAPRGWAQCDGQILPINQNQALFSLLGTTYGGDGRTNFALPDLRGRAATHAGNGPDLTARNLGDMFGEENQSLGLDKLPQHSHYAN